MPGYGAYQTSDQRWIYLLMLTDGHWLKFSQAMGLPTDDSLATLRQRKKVREQVEDLVKSAVGAHTFESATARLKSAGVGFTEVLPLERVLDAPQARQPGKLRDVSLRTLDFAVPEFPRLHAGSDGVPTQPPPELGEHTAELPGTAGVTPEDYRSMLSSGAVQEAAPNAFAWAPVRNER